MSFLSPRQYKPSAQTIKNQNAYIPPQMQQAMQQQLERLPANLKQYASGDRYVPRHAQSALMKHLSKTAPAHLKQYTDAYVQQRMITPGLMSPAGSAAHSTGPSVNPRMPDKLRLEHSNVPGSQHTAQFQTHFTPDNTPVATVPQQPTAQAYPAASTQAPQPSAPQAPYDFIMGAPQAPAKQSLKVPGSGSTIGRALVFGAGLVVLLILFVVVRGILTRAPGVTGFIPVAQDQQEIINIVSNAGQQELSAANANFVATTQLTVSQAQSSVLSYLATNKKKITPVQLNLKVSPTIDLQLTTAATSGTYNNTLKSVMKDQLTTYLADLDKAYKAAGPTGKKLLKSNYQQAQLLQNQLTASDTAASN